MVYFIFLVVRTLMGLEIIRFFRLMFLPIFICCIADHAPIGFNSRLRGRECGISLFLDFRLHLCRFLDDGKGRRRTSFFGGDSVVSPFAIPRSIYFLFTYPVPLIFQNSLIHHFSFTGRSLILPL